jgi:hypothetical protein
MLKTKTEVLPTTLSSPVIELPTPEGALDLHNFASFDRLVYTTDGTLRLEWTASEPGSFRLGNRPIERASLLFSTVAYLAVRPRDAAMPRSEDQALGYVLVLQATETSCQLRFVFNGGMEIEVYAATVSLEFEETSDGESSALQT